MIQTTDKVLPYVLIIGKNETFCDSMNDLRSDDKYKYDFD